MTLPPELRDTVRRLTRAARRADDPEDATAYRKRRDRLLDEREFTARIREEPTGDTLVCYPQEWIVDGTVETDAIDDPDRAVELRLSGVGDPDDWERVAASNERIAQTVGDRYGSVHGETAAALAAFASNHYAKPIEALTETELDEFRSDYFVRNSWPTAEQQAALEESIRHARQVATEAPTQ